MFHRMVLGTANFAKEYNGHRVPSAEVDKILDYCKQVGITWLDTATAYGTEALGGQDFKRILKMRIGDTLAIDTIHDNSTIVAHDVETLREFSRMFFGVSVNDPLEILALPESCRLIELPYSIADSARWKYARQCGAKRIHVARSVFLKGRLLKDFTPYDCIMFVLGTRWIDYCIIGTDSLEQFKRTLEPFERFRDAATDDPEIVDTRRF